MPMVHSNGCKLYVGFNFWLPLPTIVDTIPKLWHATIVYVDIQQIELGEVCKSSKLLN